MYYRTHKVNLEKQTKKQANNNKKPPTHKQTKNNHKTKQIKPTSNLFFPPTWKASYKKNQTNNFQTSLDETDNGNLK